MAANTTNALETGAQATGTLAWNGWLDEIRITKGVSRAIQRYRIHRADRRLSAIVNGPAQKSRRAAGWPGGKSAALTAGSAGHTPGLNGDYDSGAWRTARLGVNLNSDGPLPCVRS
jgi:hypothetical protein